jgi:hypothetical protein
MIMGAGIFLREKSVTVRTITYRDQSINIRIHQSFGTVNVFKKRLLGSELIWLRSTM